MADPKPQYIHSQTFLDGDMWGAHEVVGVLLARGIAQIALSREGNEFTVSWPERNPPDVMHLPHDNPGIVA